MVLGVLGAAVCIGGPGAAIASAATQSFTAPGTYAFTIPSNVLSITVNAVGAAGGQCEAAPGGGAAVTATLPVSPGEQLSVIVGGAGAACPYETRTSVLGGAGGSGGGGGGGNGHDVGPGGGGGGGASGVGPGTLAATSSPLIVAAGGGGAAYEATGGNAGSSGEDGSATGSGGKPGTQTAGGDGGVAGDSHAGAGAAGTPGAGGNGGFGDTTGPSAAGGGGGGGYYGGGGGGGSSAENLGGGGGGGSSFVAASATGVTAPTPTVQPSMVTINDTPQPAPVATTGTASAVSGKGATVHGTVNPEGLATSYKFEYGTTTAYGHSSASTSAGSGSANVPESAVLKGIKPGKTYHYRIVATNASGTTDGADATFKTKVSASIKVSPSTVSAGKRVRVFGNAGRCKRNDTVTLISSVFGPGFTFAGQAAESAKVGSGGKYSVTTTIPSSRAAGSYTITARCGGGNLGVHARLHVKSSSPSFTG